MKIKDILNNQNIDENQKKLALTQVLNLSIPELLLKKDKELTKKEYKKYKKLEKGLKKGIPLAYITKKAYFYNEEFYVNKNVLIPRPETELLVEKTNKLIEKYIENKNINIIEIGTGSGVIAITLNKLQKNAKITATEISRKALKVAKKNQKIHKTKIKLTKTDLYKGINQKFDVIISNPPYIETTSKNVEEQVLKHEPHLALFAGEDGLKCYKKIIKNLKTITKENHIIAFETGEHQKQELTKLLQKQFPNDKIITKKDLNNYDRYIFSIHIK